RTWGNNGKKCCYEFAYPLMRHQDIIIFQYKDQYGRKNCNAQRSNQIDLTVYIDHPRLILKFPIGNLLKYAIEYVLQVFQYIDYYWKAKTSKNDQDDQDHLKCIVMDNEWIGQ